MNYIVNGRRFIDVEDAFNTFVECIRTNLNSVIFSVDDNDNMREIIRIDNCKLVYQSLYGTTQTGLRSQYVGYVLTNAGTVKKAVNAIKSELKALSLRVDKTEFEDLMITYYMINTENFVKAYVIDKIDYVEVYINNKLIGTLRCQ